MSNKYRAAHALRVCYATCPDGWEGTVRRGVHAAPTSRRTRQPRRRDAAMLPVVANLPGSAALE
ncbi:hypothetical protein PUN28_011034 [Cardiocondyla obscurior]|uniref:Uncharacterized protein n=1 Tax=Cardiocondyla obscurior TaxID=286306 RepID=A0AAW2FJ79_9HYME